MKPNEIKALQGTLRKDRVKKNAIKPTIEVGLTPPDDLNEWASKYWIDIVGEYVHIGLITRVDVEALHSLCTWYGTMREAQDLVSARGLEVAVEKVTPKGEVISITEVNPMIAVADKAFKNYLVMCKEFGVTPMSRTRLNSPVKNESNPFDEFLND